AINRKNFITGPDARFIGGRPFERVEDDNLGFAASVADRLRLDGHTDAVVLAVLVLTHLGIGLWVIEVGMRVEDVEHSGNGAVVDGLVGLICVHRFGVVMLDQRIDNGEGVERVSQGGLIAGRLSGDLLVNERTKDRAGSEKKAGGEESAAGAGSHRLWLPQRADRGAKLPSDTRPILTE